MGRGEESSLTALRHIPSGVKPVGSPRERFPRFFPIYKKKRKNVLFSQSNPFPGEIIINF